MDKNKLRRHLILLNPILIDSKMKNIIDVSKEQKLSVDDALIWAIAYWIKHN